MEDKKIHISRKTYTSPHSRKTTVMERKKINVSKKSYSSSHTRITTKMERKNINVSKKSYSSSHTRKSKKSPFINYESKVVDQLEDAASDTSENSIDASAGDSFIDPSPQKPMTESEHSTYIESLRTASETLVPDIPIPGNIQVEIDRPEERFGIDNSELNYTLDDWLIPDNAPDDLYEDHEQLEHKSTSTTESKKIKARSSSLKALQLKRLGKTGGNKEPQKKIRKRIIEPDSS